MGSPPTPRVRYRFGAFVVSPARRLLLHEDRPIPLIPRYFDLLLLLLEHRQEAVRRQVILDRVWSDVVVSDGALTQAVRTLRRTLEAGHPDVDAIRTVARHGYQLVFPGVVEEPDEAAIDAPAPPAEPTPESEFSAALERLLTGADEETRREAAETLHALGTAEALRRLGRRPGHAAARALLRDARWDVPGAGPVPLFGTPDGVQAIAALVSLRLRRAMAVAGARWASASAGGGLAGLAAGTAGGILLRHSPGAHLPATIPIVLGLIGALIGAVGAAGVGAGLAAAEVVVREMRAAALAIFGALGGGIVGAVAHLLGQWMLAGLFGGDLGAAGGGLEGVVIGAAAGIGYGLATHPPGGGMAAPRGARRWQAALLTGAACAAAGVLLTRLGRPLGGASLDLLARSFPGSQVGLAPLARWFGESELGPVTRTVLAIWECGIFGLGLALGLTRRPR